MTEKECEILDAPSIIFFVYINPEASYDMWGSTAKVLLTTYQHHIWLLDTGLFPIIIFFGCVIFPNKG